MLVSVVAVLCVAPFLTFTLLPREAFERSSERKPPPDIDLPVWMVLFPLAAVALLPLRRRYPRATLAGIVAIAAASTAVVGSTGLLALPTMIALYHLGVTTDRRTSLTGVGATCVVLCSITVFRDPGMWPQIIGVVIWIALPWCIAEAVRNRRAYLIEVEERARRAEETKEEEARRQVAEERIRIARELHDILAHSIAVINVQSGVAAHVIDGDVAQARQALVHINDASDAALRELRATLDVLRQDGDPAAPTRPAPGLADVDELFDGLRASGVTVRPELPADGVRVPPEVGAVAYRVLQEALTNVLKHAQANAVDVRVTVGGDAVRLDVHDDGVGSSDPPPEGHGRVGMRERVHALGGIVDDGPDERGYRVRVQLPLGTSGRRR